MSIDEQYKTTASLLRKARKDPDPVSCFANGRDWNDTQEAIFVVKGKRKVRQAFATLVAAGLLTSNPVTPKTDKCQLCGCEIAVGAGLCGECACEDDCAPD